MPYSILIVDDEEDVKRLFELQFSEEVESKKYDLHFAYNGLDALKLIEEIDVDIIFLDIKMPKMNGNELLKRLTPLYPMIKVIMVTAYTDTKNIRHALNHGAFDFITKPIDFVDLKAALEKTCSLIDQLKENTLYRDELIGARHILEKI